MQAPQLTTLLALVAVCLGVASAPAAAVPPANGFQSLNVSVSGGSTSPLFLQSTCGVRDFSKTYHYPHFLPCGQPSCWDRSDRPELNVAVFAEPHQLTGRSCGDYSTAFSCVFELSAQVYSATVGSRGEINGTLLYGLQGATGGTQKKDFNNMMEGDCVRVDTLSPASSFEFCFHGAC